MLEVLSFVGLVFVLSLIYLFVKFVGFRKRLIAEFARRGIPHDVANDVYLRAADFINSMNADGKPTSLIVDEVLRRYPEYFR